MTQGSKAGELVPIGVEALALQAADEQETTRTLERYGYFDTTLDQLVMQVRQRVQRSTEDMLEIGRAVCCLRELPRGRYGAAIASIGLSADTARRLAGVAMKFLGQDRLRPLLDLDQSKIYELALLDDADLEAMAEDPARLDAVERMSVSELRVALRAARYDNEAKDDRLRSVHGENAALRDEKASRTQYTPNQLEIDWQKRHAHRLRFMHEAAVKVMTEMNSFGQALNDTLEQSNDAEREHALQTARWLAQQLAGLYLNHGIDVDFQEVVSPSWTRQPLATAGEE